MLPFPPTTILPFAAIGEVQCWTWQVLVLVKTAAPVSPSTPVSLPLFMNQTTTLLVPSVVVLIGPGVFEAEAHQTTCGLGGAPAGMSTDITTAPPGPVDGQLPLPSVENTTCIPCDVM